MRLFTGSSIDLQATLSADRNYATTTSALRLTKLLSNSQEQNPVVAVAESKTTITMPVDGFLIIRCPVVKTKAMGARMVADADGQSRLQVVTKTLENPEEAKKYVYFIIRSDLVKPPDPATQPADSKLEFRIVPNAVGSSRQPVLPLFIGEGTPKKYVPEALKELAEHGPDLARQRKDVFQWFELGGNVTFPDAVIGEHKGRKYILLAARPPYVMVPGEGKDAWGLTKVYATKNNQNRPAVGFELDERGAKLFSALTKANLNSALAIVIDGKVISAPTIMSALGKTGIITGQFTEQEVTNLVETLRAGMPPATQPASQPLE